VLSLSPAVFAGTFGDSGDQNRPECQDDELVPVITVIGRGLPLPASSKACPDCGA
jgi:hypothetical protein